MHVHVHVHVRDQMTPLHLIRTSALTLCQIAVFPEGKEALRLAGAVDVLPRLRDTRLSDGTREVSALASCAHALLVGREEEDAGLTKADMDAIVRELKKVLTIKGNNASVTHTYDVLAACREIAVSDRHLRMMLDSGILEIFPLGVDPAFGEPWKEPIRGKMMGAHAAETVAAIALNAALMPEGNAILKANAAAVQALQALVDMGGVLHLKHAQKDARLTLFEVSETNKPASSVLAAAPAGGGANPALDRPNAGKKHVMLSYCWAQQQVVLRLADALKAKGFVVWIDVENMRGSTIDAMAEAVENAAVVCVCMSKEYKESVNCRFEANYVVQQRVPYVCLLMQGGYKPKGWLGIMQGTHLYYELHSATLESGAFDVKVGQVARDLAQHTSVRSAATSPAPAPAAPPAASPAASPAAAVKEIAHLKDCSSNSKAVNTAVAVRDSSGGNGGSGSGNISNGDGSTGNGSSEAPFAQARSRLKTELAWIEQNVSGAENPTLKAHVYQSYSAVRLYGLHVQGLISTSQLEIISQQQCADAGAVQETGTGGRLGRIVSLCAVGISGFCLGIYFSSAVLRRR